MRKLIPSMDKSFLLSSLWRVMGDSASATAFPAWPLPRRRSP